MRVAVLVNIDSNDHEKIHTLMLGVFSQSYLKKEVFISVSKSANSPDVHKVIAAAKDQSVVPIHMVNANHGSADRSNHFTKRLALLKHSYEMGFDAFSFAEVGTVWKPSKLSVCVDKLSAFRIEHLYDEPKICVTDFGFHNLRVQRRVESYCRDINFELTKFLTKSKVGDIPSYPLPPGNIVFDRVAAKHVCDKNVSVPIIFEQWVLMVCSLGPNSVHVVQENMFEAEWSMFGGKLSQMCVVENQLSMSTRNKNIAVVLEAKRQQLERLGLRKNSEPLRLSQSKIDKKPSVVSRPLFFRKSLSAKNPWCESRFRQCVGFLNGETI